MCCPSNKRIYDVANDKLGMNWFVQPLRSITGDSRDAHIQIYAGSSSHWDVLQGHGTSMFITLRLGPSCPIESRVIYSEQVRLWVSFMIINYSPPQCCLHPALKDYLELRTMLVGIDSGIDHDSLICKRTSSPEV